MQPIPSDASNSVTINISRVKGTERWKYEGALFCLQVAISSVEAGMSESRRVEKYFYWNSLLDQ